MSVKYVAMKLISFVDKGSYSNIVLNDAFKEFYLTAKEKAFITEIFYGVLRNKNFLDYMIEKNTKVIKKEWIRNLLRISIYQLTFMSSDAKGVVWEATEIAKKHGIAISKFINGTLRNYLRNKDLEIKKLHDEKNYEILYSIPQYFCDILEKQYGSENLNQAIISLKKIPYLSVRVNKLKYSEEEFEEFFEEKMYRETNKDIQIINVKGDMKMRLLEELRGYNFKRIDKKNEFNELVEKFIIMLSKTKLFYIKGLVTELDYEAVKTLLSIKNIELKIDKRAYGKLKLQKSVGDNLDTLKDTLLRQANSIYKDEELTFNIFEADSKVLKYANLFIKEDSKKEKKKKKKLKEKVQIEIAEQELEKVKYKS